MIDWEDLPYQTSERFGGTLPHPDTATAIQAVYLRAPAAVTRAIDRIANEYAAGEVASPWGILRHRVSQIQTTEQAATRSNDRDKTIARAEQWLRTAGLHYDRESEIIDELFGDRGRLLGHHTPDLQDRMVALWHELRPLGQQVETEALERAERQNTQRERAANIQPNPETEEQRIARLRALAARKAGVGNIDTREVIA